MNWPGGELFALDIGTNMEKDNTYEETQDVETQVILLIHLPAGLELAKDTWYQVSMNSSVFIPALERGEGLNVSNGHVLEDQFERCRIGRALCSYYHLIERQTYDTPEPSAPRRRMTA